MGIKQVCDDLPYCGQHVCYIDGDNSVSMYGNVLFKCVSLRGWIVILRCYYAFLKANSLEYVIFIQFSLRQFGFDADFYVYILGTNIMFVQSKILY